MVNSRSRVQINLFADKLRLVFLRDGQYPIDSRIFLGIPPCFGTDIVQRVEDF